MIHLIAKHSILQSHFVPVHGIHRVACIIVNVISIVLDIVPAVVGMDGALNYVFGIIFFLLSACVLYGAIAYKTGLLVLAFVGNFIKAVLATIGFILILLTVGKDGRFEESNGVTYELDMAALIIIGVIGK
jgi:hypothetical protein